MYCANTPACSLCWLPKFFMCSNTVRFSTSTCGLVNSANMVSGSLSINECHLKRCCAGVYKGAFTSLPSKLADFSCSLSFSSKRRKNNKKVNCSITVSGLLMPPVQNVSQILSTWLFNSPVTIVAFSFLYLSYFLLCNI